MNLKNSFVIATNVLFFFPLFGMVKDFDIAFDQMKSNPQYRYFPADLRNELRKFYQFNIKHIKKPYHSMTIDELRQDHAKWDKKFRKALSRKKEFSPDLAYRIMNEKDLHYESGEQKLKIRKDCYERRKAFLRDKNQLKFYVALNMVGLPVSYALNHFIPASAPLVLIFLAMTGLIDYYTICDLIQGKMYGPIDTRNTADEYREAQQECDQLLERLK